MKYYIGDPCYVIHGNAWTEIVKNHYKNNTENPHHVVNGHDCYLFTTAHGDGLFQLKDGQTVVAHLGVDAGMIGAVPVDAVTDLDMLDLGYVADINLSSDTCKSDDGDMTFGPYTVKTSWE
jgi:hypothetical protein